MDPWSPSPERYGEGLVPQSELRQDDIRRGGEKGFKVRVEA